MALQVHMECLKQTLDCNDLKILKSIIREEVDIMRNMMQRFKKVELENATLCTQADQMLQTGVYECNNILQRRSQTYLFDQLDVLPTLEIDEILYSFMNDNDHVAPLGETIFL